MTFFRFFCLFLAAFSISVVSLAQAPVIKTPAKVFGFGTVNDAVWSPDGKRIASVSHNVIAIFETTNGARIRSIVVPNPTDKTYVEEPNVLSVDYSKDGKLIAAGDNRGRVRIWDTATWALKKTISVKDGLVNSIAFSPSAQYIVIGSGDLDVFNPVMTEGSLKIFSVSTGSLYRTLNTQNYIKAVAWSRVTSSTDIVSADSFGIVRLWNSGQANSVRTYETTYNTTSYDVAFSIDGKKLAAAIGGDSIYLWNKTAAAPAHVYTDARDKAYSVAFNTSGASLIVGGFRIAKRYATSSAYNVQKTYPLDMGTVKTTIFAPDAQSTRVLVVANDWGGELNIFNTSNGSIVRAFLGHNRGVYSVAVTPDGRHIATGPDTYGSESEYKSSQVRIYDTSTGAEYRTLPKTGGSASVDYSPDGKMLITAAFGNNSLKLWSDTGNLIRAFQEKDGANMIPVSSSCGAFAVDGTKIITGVSTWISSVSRWDGIVRVFDTAKGTKDGQFSGMGGDISTLDVAEGRNSDLFVAGTGTYGGSAYLRSVTTATARTFAADDWVSGVAITPDGKYAAAGGTGHGVQIWDTRTGEKIRTLWASGGECLAFSPSGEYLAAGSGRKYDSYGNDGFGQVQIWNVATGSLVKYLVAQRSTVSAVAFTGEGTQVLSASLDGTVMLWDKVLPKPLATDRDVWKSYE